MWNLRRSSKSSVMRGDEDAAKGEAGRALASKDCLEIEEEGKEIKGEKEREGERGEWREGWRR